MVLYDAAPHYVLHNRRWTQSDSKDGLMGECLISGKIQSLVKPVFEKERRVVSVWRFDDHLPSASRNGYMIHKV